MKSNIDPACLLEVRQEYGRWIRKIREGKGMTQEQLSEKIGVSRTTIGKIEAGKWNIGIDTISVLAFNLDFYPMFVENKDKTDLLNTMIHQWEKHNPITDRPRYPSKEEWLHHQLEIGNITMEAYLKQMNPESKPIS